jgi:hypothetical protein
MKHLVGSGGGRFMLCISSLCVLFTALSFSSSHGITINRQRMDREHPSLRFSSNSDSAYWYMYRYLSTYYDSTQLMCIFGESCVIGADTTPIRFDDWFIHEKDSTLSYINSIAKTLPFRLGGAASISLWRALIIIYSGPTQLNVDLADTCSWIAELWNYRTGAKIAILDSLTTLPLLEGRRFPTIAFPDSSTSVRLIQCNLSPYNFAIDDSGIITIRMEKKGIGNPGYCVRDKVFFYGKTSENHNFAGAPKSSTERQEAGIPEDNVAMQLSPNPSQNAVNIRIELKDAHDFSLELINAAGQRLSTIFSGSRGAGIHNFGYVYLGSFPSGSYTVLYKDLHAGYSITRNLIIAK